jgi:hypothetical protein
MSGESSTSGNNGIFSQVRFAKADFLSFQPPGAITPHSTRYALSFSVFRFELWVVAQALSSIVM